MMRTILILLPVILAAADVELRNGLYLNGALDIDLAEQAGAVRQHAQGKNGTWAVTLTPPGGTSLHLYLHQIHRLRADATSEWIMVTPRDQEPEAFANPPAHSPGKEILPFGWRGAGNGAYPDAVPPTGWHPVWRAAVRCNTHASPIIVGNRIIILDQPHRLVCRDRTTGKLLWARDNPSFLTDDDAGMPNNDFMWETYRLTTPTPITDGQYIYASFGHGPHVCYDLDGNLQWATRTNWGTHMRSGRPTSPALVGDVLVVAGYGPDNITGIDKRTGAIQWQEQWGGGAGKGAVQLVILNGKPFAFCAGGLLVDEHGTMHGRKVVGGCYGASPVIVGDLAWALDTGKKGRCVRALRLGPDNTTTTIWQRPWSLFNPSPIILEGRLYVSGSPADTKSRRALHVLDSHTGDSLAQVSDVPAPYASPALAGDHIVQLGPKDVVVIATGASPRIVTRFAHPMSFTRHGGGTSGGSPVFDGNRWYVRDQHFLWCLSSTAE